MVTIIMVLIEVTVQQSYRMNGNDPQIQMARDIALGLEKGKQWGSLVHLDSIDIARSLGVFIVGFNQSIQPTNSTGFLNGKPPFLPSGVFEFAKNHGEHLVSWQPKPNVRMALVVEPVNTQGIAYVAVGRSLKEIEIREANLSKMVLMAWLFCIGIIIARFFLQNRFAKTEP